MAVVSQAGLRTMCEHAMRGTGAVVSVSVVPPGAKWAVEANDGERRVGGQIQADTDEFAAREFAKALRRAWDRHEELPAQRPRR